MGRILSIMIMIIIDETFDVIVLWASIDYLLMFTSKIFCVGKAPTPFFRRNRCVALLIDYHGMFVSKEILYAPRSTK